MQVIQQNQEQSTKDRIKRAYNDLGERNIVEDGVNPIRKVPPAVDGLDAEESIFTAGNRKIFG